MFKLALVVGGGGGGWIVVAGGGGGGGGSRVVFAVVLGSCGCGDDTAVSIHLAQFCYRTNQSTAQ